MSTPPDGLVTFLFTDIEGSTILAQKYPDSLPLALTHHNDILNDSIGSSRGYVFEITGDAFCASFTNPADAIKAAVEIQKNLINQDWGETPIKVRIGINRGEAKWNGKRYTGYMTLSRTQRIMSAAHGGQVIISSEVYEEVKGIVNYSFRDMGERRLKSLIRPEHLYQLIPEGLPAEFPPLKTLDARPNNLPVQTTSFIGRMKEIDEIKQILPKTHLLTLLGSGGTGKTRISLQSGADMIDDFTHGVWFIELAQLTEPSLVVQEAASVFGLKESGSTKLTDILIDHLKEKELLLILDNCEHLIDECAKISDTLIKKCAKLKILATSRERLHIEGEAVYRIPSLTIPDMRQIHSLESVTEYESVRLFIDRAVSAKPDFNISIENIQSVSQICNHLDGIPYAIELAAAKVRSMSVDKISERLNDRFRLLTGVNRTALPRQQTLRTMIDWSYDLLNEHEKALLRKLSVFTGGWTLESAENICSENKNEEYEVLDILSSLVDKSLVIFDEDKDRYRMLETVKEYSSEKLSQSAEAEKYRSKHLEYFMNLAEEAEPELYGAEPMKKLNYLEQELDNFRTGLNWSNENNSCLSAGQRLAGALRKFWLTLGYFSEGYKWLSKMIDKSDPDSNITGKLLRGIGVMSVRLGKYSEAQDVFERSLQIYDKTDDKKAVSELLENLGIVYCEKGDYLKAKEFHERSLSYRLEEKDRFGIASSYNNLAVISLYTGNYQKARGMLEKALTIYRELGEKHDIATTLHGFSNLPLDNFNDYAEAKAKLEEALSIFKETKDKRGIGFTLGSIGSISLYQNNIEDAKAKFNNALTILKEINHKRGVALQLNNLGEIAYLQKDSEEAIKYFNNSKELFQEIGNKHGYSESLYSLGNIFREKGDFGKALNYYKESLEIRREINDNDGIYQTLEGLGNLYLAEGNLSRSIKLFGAAKALRDLIGSPVLPYQKEAYDNSIHILSVRSGEEEFKKSWEEGRAMDLELAINLALGS